jgi:ENTS family enterobactin (siderophore) exporter
MSVIMEAAVEGGKLCPLSPVVRRAATLRVAMRPVLAESRKRQTGRSGMRVGQIALDVAPLREGRDFRLLFTGRFISMGGNAVATTAASWQVFALTRSSLAVGMLTLASSAGMFTGLMAGGMLADRNDRRMLMLASRAPLAVLAALLMINSLLPRPALWAVYVLVLLVGGLSGIGSPASTAAVPALVRPDQLAAAAALNAMGSQLGQLGGPALAGVLIAGPGLASCYGIDAACFAVFGLTLWFMRPLPPTVRAGRPGLRSMAEGLRHVRRNSVVGGMLAVDTSAMIFGMPSALFPALAREHFHGGAATFGLLAAAPGLGAMIGAATSGWTGRLKRPGVVIIVAGLAWGAAIVGFGLSTSLAIALAFLALAGMSDLISEVLRNALLQHYTPDELRGRVSSLYLAQVTTAPSLGNVEAGLVAQLFSTTISVVSGGLACVTGALILGAVHPALRRARLARPDDGDRGGGLAEQAPASA